MTQDELDVSDLLDEEQLKKEDETDSYQCQLCGSLIEMKKGEKPTECYKEQGGCGKKGDFILMDGTVKAKEVKPEKKTKDELKHEKIKEAKSKEAEVNEILKSGVHEDLKSDVYLEMDAYVDMVAYAIAFGAIIEGPGGVGKTWRVLNRLRDVDYAYTDSFTTPQALYIWFYENRNKEVLIVDDVANFSSNEKVLAFLKGALWEVNGQRILHYMTTKPMQDEYGNYVPNAFVMNARMIIITNKLNRRSAHVNAVLTRVNYCKVLITHEELMNILNQIAKKDYPGLALNERTEVYEFLKNNTSEANDDLNIRSLIKCFQHKVYSNRIKQPDKWKQLAMISIIQRNPTLMTVEELVNDPDYKTEEERIAEFRNRTNKSRATYFRLKEQMKTTGDKLKKED